MKICEGKKEEAGQFATVKAPTKKNPVKKKKGRSVFPPEGAKPGGRKRKTSQKHRTDGIDSRRDNLTKEKKRNRRKEGEEEGKKWKLWMERDQRRSR